jgi:opacity protein-like surface antigen
MKALMFGACLAATLATTLSAPALAQPGDGYQDRPDPYYDQPPAPQPPAQPAPPYRGGYQSDQGYGQADQGYGQYQPPPSPPPGQPGFQVYQGGQPYGGYAPNVQAYRATPQWRYDGGAGFTGDVGRAWRNPEGQICRWRQLSWQDAYGRPAYKWVPHCRDD